MLFCCSFQINYAKLILGKNNVIVLADKATIPYLTGGYPTVIMDKLAPENVLESNIDDIWIRDFGTVGQINPVKVGYQPQYLDKRWSKVTQNTFLDFLKKSGVQIVKKGLEDKRENLSSASLSLEYYPEIYIDGGNVVYDFNGNAIMTDRFISENKQFKDKESARSAVSNALGFSNVVIISQYGNVNEDTTGHSDGMVSFIDDNTVAYGQLDEPHQSQMVNELKAGLPNFKLVELPSYYFDEKDSKIQFTSACGCHVNSLTTKDFLYMPTFGHDPKSQAKGYTVANDEEVFNIVKSNTTKQVVKVPVPYEVCILGGSVRCLSMQIEGPIADQLISLAAANKG